MNTMFPDACKRLLQILLATAFTIPAVAQQPTEGPHLFVTAKDFVRIRKLAAKEPWAKKAQEEIVKEADAFPESYEKQFGLKDVELPPEGGQWGHYYACPQSGRQLVFTPPNHNVCPDTGQEFPGYPYDQVVYEMRANALGSAALNLALAFRLTGNEHYATESANLLKAYADRYLSYPIHDKNGGSALTGARVFPQTLDESIWLINMAWAYDLLRGTHVLSPAERRHIEGDFFLPAAALNARAAKVTYNWQSWINAAIAAVGYTLGDRKLVTQALDGPAGFRFQMREYVVDGLWIEGTWGYQFYALGALTQLAAMAQCNGENLWTEEPKLKSLLDSPFQMMLPDGTLPPFNDSRAVSIYDQAALYEYPFAVTHDASFAAVITHGDHPRADAEGLPFGGTVDHGGRANRNALLFGVPHIASTAMPAVKNSLFPNAGYARLHASTVDLTEVIKFGPHGAGHGHFDKLGEVIYADGGMMSVDPGTQFYGVASHDTWDRSTVAHNTVVVDERSQDKATGKLIRWQEDPGFTAVEADAGPVYPGISLRRRVILTPRYILEITTADGTDGAEHTFDWVYHNFGQQELSLAAKPWSGFASHDGYQHLNSNQISKSEADWQDVFRMPAGAGLPDRGMHLWMLGDVGANGTPALDTGVMSGFGLGPDLKVPVPYVLARRQGRRTQFVTLLEPFTRKPAIHAFARETGSSSSVSRYTIEGPGWTDIVVIGERIAIEHGESR